MKKTVFPKLMPLDVYAPPLTSQVVLCIRFARAGRPGNLVLGDTAQAKTDGCQAVGKRIPLSSGGLYRREVSAGRFSQRTIDGELFKISGLTSVLQ